MQLLNQLDQFFNHRSTTKIAKDLLGKRFTYRHTSAWIVETEAYLGAKDQAAHAYHHHKAHWNRALYMAPGTIYVFTMFGSNLLNFITQPVGEPQGVLIRAAQPGNGVLAMKHRRRTSGFNLTNGPGKLAQAMGISLNLNTRILNQSGMKLDLNSSQVKHPAKIGASGRIGVPNKGKWTHVPLRYYVTGNPYVSKMPRRKMNLKTFGWRINQD